jgi:hypothetical protein
MAEPKTRTIIEEHFNGSTPFIAEDKTMATKGLSKNKCYNFALGAIV